MKYYIIVASKDHVNTGKENGFAQAGHGKKVQLDKLKQNDWIIYYSSKDKYQNGKAYQKFTAIGQVMDDEPYQVSVNTEFKPWRRNIDFYSSKDLEIRPLISELAFISNKKKWGLHLMSGFVEIAKDDFERIATVMLTEKTI